MVACGDMAEEQMFREASKLPQTQHANMVWIEGGEFVMGADAEDHEALPREKPRHLVELSGFFMDVHEVTNEQFAEFVQSTGYVTVAEREIETEQGVLEPGSMVFEKPKEYLVCVIMGNGGDGRLVQTGGTRRALNLL